MKYLVGFLLIAFVRGGVYLDLAGIGQTCGGNGFNITGFNVSPTPPAPCGNPFAITITGTFITSTSVSQIFIYENYENRQYYSQYVTISGSYVVGQAATFNFLFVPSQCSSGSYTDQISIQSQNPQQTLACWQFSYTV